MHKKYINRLLSSSSSTINIPSFTLNNGVKMPQISLGTLHTKKVEETLNYKKFAQFFPDNRNCTGRSILVHCGSTKKLHQTFFTLSNLVIVISIQPSAGVTKLELAWFFSKILPPEFWIVKTCF